MNENAIPDDKTVLLTLQNKSKPDQVIYVFADRTDGSLETRGLSDYFGLKEIRLVGEDILLQLPEYAQVLSFIFDTISTAQDLNLPYHYQNEFAFGNSKYTLYEEGDHRVLKRSGNGVPPLQV